MAFSSQRGRMSAGEALWGGKRRGALMSTVEDRVSPLKLKLDQHALGLSDTRDAVVRLEARMDRRFEGVDQRFLSVEQKLDAHFLALDGKMSRVMHLQLALLTAVVSVIGGLAIALVVRL
jgi:hypothetical protein